jgi:hypothetical protein
MDKTAAWRWANVPLPQAHVVGLGAGLLLQLIASWRLSCSLRTGHAFGWPLILAGLWLGAWAVRAAADVDLERPMYVAWTVGYVGVALVANAAWPLLMLPVVLLVTHIVVVREEYSLERQSALPTAATKPRSAGTSERRTNLTKRPWSAVLNGSGRR